MRFLDLFSGIGGFRLGMEQAGHECVGHVEIDKYANISYVAIHKPKEGEFFANDIRGVDPELLPEADVYCGGFPCQSFSVAGKRGGFEDTRGTLFFEIMRLAKVRKPAYLFLENVKGLLSHDGGQTFGTILRTLWECGYDAQWQILNSKNFGVPQNRERVFIIGHLRTGSRPEVFPIRGTSDKAIKKITKGLPQSQSIYDSTGLATTICGEGGGMGVKTGLYSVSEIKQVNQPKHSNNRVYQTDGSSPALNAMQGGNRQPFIVQPILTPGRPEKRQNGRRMKEPGEPSFTLTGQDRHGIMIKQATKKGYDTAYEGDSVNLAVPNSDTRRGRVGKGIANTLDTSCSQGVVAPCLHGFEHGTNGQFNKQLKKIGMIRRLTPLECWRLQGFPDWTHERAKAAGVSESQRYKQSGNSVTVNVIYAIAERL